jgi:hypothetical protein
MGTTYIDMNKADIKIMQRVDFMGDGDHHGNKKIPLLLKFRTPDRWCFQLGDILTRIAKFKESFVVVAVEEGSEFATVTVRNADFCPWLSTL